MPGITIIFDKKSNDKLESEYKKINDKFKQELLSIKKELKPHITLMYFSKNDGIEHYAKIKSSIIKTSNKYNSFKINVNGLALFVRGKRYILYFTIANNENFQKIHKNIWKELNNIYPDDNLYNPKVMTPHVTIPIFTSNKTNTFKIMKELSKLKFDFELTVSDIAYITGNLYKPEVYFKKKLIK